MDAGYPFKFISQHVARACKISRSSALTYKPKSNEPPRIPFVARFDPSLDPFLKKVKQEWKSFKEDDTLPSKFSLPPLVAKNNHRTFALYT